MRNIALYCMILLTFNLFGQEIELVDLKSYFGDFEGGISIFDLETNHYIQYNPGHCEKRFSPCSSFKIPNSLIGLETGVIADTSFVIEYDSILHPKDPNNMLNEPFKYWYLDLSLKNAFKYSSVWYYQELTRRVGYEQMQKKVNDLEYGNMDISGGLDRYWLCSSLQISIDEQIEFLKKFYLHELNGFSDKNMDAVKSIMLYESPDNYKLYGKTGGGNCFDNKTIGWYVGFVETDTGTKIFAMNIIVNDFSDLKNNLRIEMTKRILKELKIIQ